MGKLCMYGPTVCCCVALEGQTTNCLGERGSTRMRRPGRRGS